MTAICDIQKFAYSSHYLFPGSYKAMNLCLVGLIYAPYSELSKEYRQVYSSYT